MVVSSVPWSQHIAAANTLVAPLEKLRGALGDAAARVTRGMQKPKGTGPDPTEVSFLPTPYAVLKIACTVAGKT